jgi:type IV pilus assembly protein PilC
MSFIVTPRQLTQRAEFYHQLSQLTSAGIGLMRALEQIQRNLPSRSFHEPIQELLANLNQGLTFTDSLRKLGAWVPEFDIALIDAGERSGRLDACFRLLSDYYNDRSRIAKQVISQLIYPIGLIHFAALVFLIILPFAHSQFRDSLIWLFIRAALALAPLYLITALIIHATQSRHGERWRARIETILHPIPVLGTARRFLSLARLAAALEALINAGVNIVEAWNLAAAASGSPALRRAVENWQPQVEAGRTPAEVLNECPQFPETFANLYTGGEVSGKLDDSLKRLYQYYSEEGTRKLYAFAQWMPRLIYLLVVVVIAYKVVTFWQGYFQQINKLSHF